MSQLDSNYANTDFDLRSPESFDSLNSELSSRCCVLHYSRTEDGEWWASYEADRLNDTPENDISAILEVLGSLSEIANAELQKCTTRDFNIGVNCGDTWAHNMALPHSLVAAVAEAGCSLSFTLYPMREPDGTPKGGMNPDEEYDFDDDFGYMQFNGIDAWDCNVSADFPHPPSLYFAIHVWSGEDGPTDRQRERIRWLKSNYDRLWPEVAKTICQLHPELKETEELDGAMRERIAVHLGEHSEESVELVYDLDLPNENGRGFFISVSEQGIGESFIAE